MKPFNLSWPTLSLVDSSFRKVIIISHSQIIYYYYSLDKVSSNSFSFKSQFVETNDVIILWNKFKVSCTIGVMRGTHGARNIIDFLTTQRACIETRIHNNNLSVRQNLSFLDLSKMANMAMYFISNFWHAAKLWGSTSIRIEPEIHYRG